MVLAGVKQAEGRSARLVARRIGEAHQPRCCAACLFNKNRVHRHAQRFFPRGRVTVRGNDSLTLRCHFVHLVHCRGTRQMPTSGQMLFTMAVFGHVLIAGITLLIAVALDDSM